MSTAEKETKAQLEARLADERRQQAEADEAARAETQPAAGDEPELDPDEPLEQSVERELPELVAQPLTPEESQEAFEAEMERHGVVMLELFGEDAPRFEPCPTCMASGFALRDRDQPPELVSHPRTRKCEACAGRGQMKTGSLMEGQTQLACPICNGQGFTYPPELSGAPLGDQPALVAVPPVGFVPAPDAIRDAYGRPAGHPHFGMDPAKVGV